MLFSSLLVLVTAATSAVFGETLARDRADKACSRELEAIVFTPPNCAHDYMREITRSLVVQAPLLWTDQGVSVIETFENRYGVRAIFYDAFGNFYNYSGKEPKPIVNAFSYNYERTAALGEAFASYQGSELINSNTAFYVYSTLLWNENGQLYTVFVLMNKSNAPLVC